MRVICLLSCWGVLAVSAAVAEARPPNIVFVLVDDIGYGDFSGLGNPVIHTPTVDKFARESVGFTQFHVSPTCAPTRAALMTGRHEFKSGVTHTIDERERLSLSATTLAQVLRQAGYSTGIFGKWHLGDEPERWPDKRGFDEMLIHGGGGIGQTYPGSCGDAPGNMYQDPALLHNGRFEKTTGYCTDIFFGRALEWIDGQRKANKPFFVYLTPNAAHKPLQCPEDYAKRHRGQVSEDVAKFYGMIENIDDNFAKLLARLDEWGLARDTLVVFMTDNGGLTGVDVYNAGMRGKKGTPYEGGTRVPAFWRWPAGWAGAREVSALTAHIDVFPTLAEIAGAKPTEAVRAQVEGRSLLSLLRDSRAPWDDRTLVTHVGRWPRGGAAAAKFTNMSIRNTRFSLVNNTELYDLGADPGEQHNVVATHADETARLRSAYDQWWNSVLPRFENENVTGPAENPFKTLYREQFGGPTAASVRSAAP